MPTYKQVVNHVKKHVLWKDEYFERYYTECLIYQ